MQPVADVSVGTMADVEAVMKKYDRESNVRIWEGLPRRLIDWLMAAFAVYCIVDAIFLTTLQEIRYSVFLGMIVFLGFLTFPVRKGVERPNHMPWYDVVILLAGSGAFMAAVWSGRKHSQNALSNLAHSPSLISVFLTGFRC